MQKKERASLQAPTLPFHFWLPLLPSHFCPSISNAFSWHLLVLKHKKEKKQRKKNLKKEKKCKEMKEFTFKLSLCPFTFGSRFWPLVSAFRFKHFLLGIFFFSSRRKKKNTKKKKCREGRELTFLSCFCIWDEVLLLISPLHIPSTLSPPHSSSLVSHVSSKLYATQAWELSQAMEME
jgi:hypothetical protein